MSKKRKEPTLTPTHEQKVLPKITLDFANSLWVKTDLEIKTSSFTISVYSHQMGPSKLLWEMIEAKRLENKAEKVVLSFASTHLSTSKAFMWIICYLASETQLSEIFMKSLLAATRKSTSVTLVIRPNTIVKFEIQQTEDSDIETKVSRYFDCLQDWITTINYLDITQLTHKLVLCCRNSIFSILFFRNAPLKTKIECLSKAYFYFFGTENIKQKELEPIRDTWLLLFRAAHITFREEIDDLTLEKSGTNRNLYLPTTEIEENRQKWDSFIDELWKESSKFMRKFYEMSVSDWKELEGKTPQDDWYEYKKKSRNVCIFKDQGPKATTFEELWCPTYSFSLTEDSFN